MSAYDVQQILERLDDLERRVIRELQDRVRSLELWRATLAGAVAALTMVVTIVGVLATLH